jgi:hypothetical protein
VSQGHLRKKRSGTSLSVASTDVDLKASELFFCEMSGKPGFTHPFHSGRRIGFLLALVILSVNYTLVLYFVRAYYTRSVAIHTPKQTLTQGRRTSLKKLHMR